jgi:hypothetical protein
MKKIQWMLLAAGLLVLIMIPVWLLLILPALEKMPQDYFSRVEFVGEERIRQPGEGDLGPVFPMKEVINWQVLTRKGDVLILQMNWKAEDLNSSQVVWETRGSVGIDMNTRQLVRGYGDIDREGYFGFPVNLEKKDYEIWHPGLYGKNNAVFQREETVKGLRTYLFTFDIKDLPSSDNYPQFNPRQAVMDVKDKFRVEPVTGRIVDYEEWFESRLLKTDLPEQIIDVGTFRFTDATVLQQVQLAEKELLLRQVFKLWIPLTLGIIAMVLILGAALSGKKRKEMEVK